ncbi:hypothetical protein FisN_36Lh001 [Fistulifera solaris]|uniref:Uncharacterized protein n=1 Tax=Fistulifera solaris TaxID=1519565 RepID=A0A1Z5JHY8_FISSO|nr:hypothetical protein FisN_36Lh001 [Fistulifera solaris]|eukprot:GAX13452.1 hypothetical protein FisN_36Lh001 [Fistulifera solaris]
MLPFRLKPPAYGGKLRREKQENASPLDQNHPLRDGGPLQRAIHDDLIAQYPNFVAALNKSFLFDIHDWKGWSFTVFKTIFSDAGISLLHTQFTPPRCDAAAYSQLLYAVCFDFLRRAFQPDEDIHSFGAFSVFLLYSLFETNPHPEKLSSEMETLPMNIQHRYNPRLAFRRCYRERIRIDLEHYHDLLQLRELCLAKVASSQFELGDWDQSFKITCSLAKDTVEIIVRLMTNFDHCAYTGPCGLEALAGHGDYSVPPTTVTEKWWKENRQTFLWTDTALKVSEAPLAEFYQIPTVLQEEVEQYINQRNSMKQMQWSRDKQRRHRMRDGATHLFPMEKTGLDGLAFFSRSRKPGKKRVRLRHGFVEIAVDASTHPSRSTDSDGIDELLTREPILNNQDEKESPGFQLVLPEGVSAVIEESLQDAFETLVHRKVILPPATVATHPEEVSTLARSQSVATSVTGTGRSALRALLLKATSEIMSEGKSTTFLESQEDLSDDLQRENANDVFSDISSEEGDVTVAGSTLGRSALRDLLSYATGNKAVRKKVNKGAKSFAKRARQKQSNRKTLEALANSKNFARVDKERGEQDFFQSDADSSHSSNCDSDSSGHDSEIEDEGRAALKALLARAAAWK